MNEIVEPCTEEEKELEQKQENDRGASLVEYGLLVALIAVICIAAVRLLGTNISGSFSSIASAT